MVWMALLRVVHSHSTKIWHESRSRNTRVIIVFVTLGWWSNGIDQRPMIAFADIWVLFVCLLGKHFLLYLLSHIPWDYYKSRPKFIKTILPNAVSSNRTTIAQRHYIILYLWYLWRGVSFPLRKWINGSGHVKCT